MVTARALLHARRHDRLASLADPRRPARLASNSKFSAAGVPELQCDRFQCGALIVVKRREDVALDVVAGRGGPCEEPMSLGCESQRPASAVVGGRPAGDQASGFEAVKQLDEVRRVDDQTCCELSLAATGVAVDEDEDAQFAGSQIQLSHRRHEATIDRLAKAHEQKPERRLFVGIVGHACGA
jgi:hypothetical protein